MFRWMKRLYNRRLRRLDVEVLWPQICQMAPDELMAKAAFARHVFGDPAWQDLPYEVKAKYIDNLDPVPGSRLAQELGKSSPIPRAP